MIAICKTSEAFEDRLTTGRSYPLISLRNASVRIINDAGELCWYGLGRFTLAPSPSEQTVTGNELLPC